MHEGGSYVVYCRCIEEAEGETHPTGDAFGAWAWIYAFVPGIDEGLVFDSIVEFMDGYLEWYENVR